MNKETMIVMASVMLSIAGMANAEDLGGFVSKQRELQSMQQDVDKLELTLKKQQLLDKIANVGKEPASKQESGKDQNAQSQVYFNPSMQGGPGRANELTPEEKLNARKDRALDDIAISAVLESQNDGALQAELVSLKNGSVFVVSKGDVVGNWRIDQITLGSVRAKNVTKDETKIIRRGSSS